jgi:hypothetical protein
MILMKTNTSWDDRAWRRLPLAEAAPEARRPLAVATRAHRSVENVREPVAATKAVNGHRRDGQRGQRP